MLIPEISKYNLGNIQSTQIVYPEYQNKKRFGEELRDSFVQGFTAGVLGQTVIATRLITALAIPAIQSSAIQFTDQQASVIVARHRHKNLTNQNAKIGPGWFTFIGGIFVAGVGVAVSLVSPATGATLVSIGTGMMASGISTSGEEAVKEYNQAQTVEERNRIQEST